MKKILSTLDLIMLSLMVVSLPSLEAPKNIFLVGYLLTRGFSEVKQFKEGLRQWDVWDSLFMTIVFTAFLSTLFAGFSGHEEWKGFGVLLTAVLTGWFLSRTQYTKKQYQFLFKLIILTTIPPLLWGLYEFLLIHSRRTLEIHSVGHVNHSAIYLVMIFGASLAWALSEFNTLKEKIKLNWRAILISLLSFLFFISLILGQSRGAFGFTIILSVILFFLIAKNKSLKILGVISLVSILAFIISIKAPIVQKQINYQKDHNVLSYRDRVWNVSMEASNFYPLLGIGMSNWHFINLEQLKSSVEKKGEIFDPKRFAFPGHSHNLYLTALVERGMVGLIVTFAFLATWIHQLIKTLQWAKKSKESTYLWGGSFSAWIATFGIGLVNTTFHHEHAIVACLFLGIYLAYTRLFLK